MHIYYQKFPVEAVVDYFDGNRYVHANAETYAMPDGRRHARETDVPRLLRVSHVDNGLAFAEIGKAGDAIACTDNLPCSVVVRHVEDRQAVLP